MCDLLSQTELYFDYTVIIEEGLSYGIYTKTVDPNAEPIILQPDGSLTINYLDTHGLPLTADHLASATALVATIVGVSRDEDRQLSREAQIAKCVTQLYDDVFEEWRHRISGRLMEIARHAARSRGCIAAVPARRASKRQWIKSSAPYTAAVSVSFPMVSATKLRQPTARQFPNFDGQRFRLGAELRQVKRAGIWCTRQYPPWQALIFAAPCRAWRSTLKSPHNEKLSV